jgi:xanthine dehydrogenase accessory factor
MEQAIFHKINELIAKGETFAIATIIRTTGSTPRKPGTKMLIMGDGSTFGTIGGGCIERGVVSEALDALKVRKPRSVSLALEEEERGGIGMRCGGRVEVFIDVMGVASNLLVVGGGHVGAQVARLGKRLGFSVTVVDPFAKENLPQGVRLVREPIHEGVPKIEITPETYIVITTEHKADEVALKAVIESPARYIGMIGSRNRVELVFKNLIDEGIPGEKLERVHAPIGLDIGAQTPEEIAVSIMAEIIKTRRNPQATGKSLSELFHASS